jgi:hypothetical protein
VDPDVAAAVPELVERGIVSEDTGAVLLRAVRGELVSLRGDLRALLYAGVSVAVAGVGLLVKENLDRLGPVTIAAAIGLAAAACLGWVARTAPPFSWREQVSPHLAFDYLLLLGTLLAATDLAYVEVEFTPLGPNWPWHLLIVAMASGVLAFRYDSRVLFSLALTTLAAWRGVSLTLLGRATWAVANPHVLRWNAIVCGAVFVAAGRALARFERKAHFEPIAAHLGWLLVLGGLASGAVEESHLGDAWPAYVLLLGAAGVLLAALASRARRFSLLAFGAVAVYIAASRVAVAWLEGEFAMFTWFCASAIACVIALATLQRRMRTRP